MSTQVVVQPTSSSAQKTEVLDSAETKLKTLSAEDLKHPPKETKAEPAGPTGPAYSCITQRGDPISTASIVVGLFTSIPRWKLGSVINFATSADGYPTPADAVYAANQLIAAADEWNSYKIGVRFNWVANVDDAAFVLAYGGEQDTVLASAFFPNAKPLNTLLVYKYGFDKNVQDGGWTNYSILKNVFLHELGHVLGLRHEFAMDANRYEGGAFRLGQTNELSVMSYNFPPKIQDTDIVDTRAFYKLPLFEYFSPDN